MPGCKYDGKEYSEGSVICVNRRELKCRGNEWQDIGECNHETSPMNDIPTVPDDDKEILALDPRILEKPPQGVSTYTVYADHFSIRQTRDFYFFKAAPTIGHFCSNSMVREYRVPRLDVQIEPERRSCPRTARLYRVITFSWPD
jgi:hypothetical protein